MCGESARVRSASKTSPITRSAAATLTCRNEFPDFFEVGVGVRMKEKTAQADPLRRSLLFTSAWPQRHRRRCEPTRVDRVRLSTLYRFLASPFNRQVRFLGTLQSTFAGNVGLQQ